MKDPIFRYYDPFNDVYSKTSNRYASLANFFMCFEKARKAGNCPALEQYIGRKDRDNMSLFSGDIIEVSYFHPGNEGQPGGNDPGDSGHYIGVIRYQPSKGYVMSRIIKLSDSAEPGTPYEKVRGCMLFAVSSTRKIGNINQHPELIKELDRC